MYEDPKNPCNTQQEQAYYKSRPGQVFLTLSLKHFFLGLGKE